MRASLPLLAGYVTKLKGIRPSPLPAPPPPPPAPPQSPPAHHSIPYIPFHSHNPNLNRSAWPNSISPEFAFDHGLRLGGSGSNSREDDHYRKWSHPVLVRIVNKNLQISATSESRDRALGILWLLLPSIAVTTLACEHFSDHGPMQKTSKLEFVVYGQGYQCRRTKSARQIAGTKTIERTKAEIREDVLYREKQEESDRRQGRLPLDMMLQLCTLEAMMQSFYLGN